MGLEKVCSNCVYATVKINKKMINTRQVDDSQPFSSPAIVKSVSCKFDVWKPLVSIALMPTVDNMAVDCRYYEENN